MDTVGKQWRGMGTKVVGATHIRNGLPCQDAIRIETYGTYVVAAIADGHGSEACPYSDEGSQAAVDCLQEIFADIFDGDDAETKSVIENSRELRLPRQLASAWMRRVEEIHRKTRKDEEFSYTLYGTTALCVVASEEFIFALQLGDGDILVIPEPPLQGYWMIEPENMPGNETYSLCMPDCWRYVRTNMFRHDDRHKTQPALIMLTTDGYYNSFITAEGFVKAGTDILGLLRTEGEGYVSENLEDWLIVSSAEGSGDDIAMALIY